VLYLTAISIAHQFEGLGRTDLALQYFGEALRYDPHDYAAAAGMARLAETVSDQRDWWRRAFDSVDLTQTVEAGLGLPTRVMSRHGTFFAFEALANWIEAGFGLGDMDTVVEAVGAALHLQSDIGVNVAMECLRRGQPQAAKRCLDLVLGAEPQNAQALVVRSEACVRLGLIDQARQDAERATRCVGRGTVPDPGAI
jgi:tetratricopeptide (TPR) repeat protein